MLELQEREVLHAGDRQLDRTTERQTTGRHCGGDEWRRVLPPRAATSVTSQEECKTMLDALNRVTACYRHLVITLGSTSDSQNLREELRKTRKKAQELAAANRTKLTALLKDKNISKEDRSEYERLWVLFTSSMELLDVDMKRSLEIGQDFPLQVPTRHLIQTGMSGSTTTVAARAMSVQNMKYEADSNIDTADLKELEAEIAHVVQMMEEMEMKVQVAPWAVEAKQEAGAELKSTVSVGNSSVGVISICEEEPKEMDSDAGLKKVFAGIIFTAIVLIAGILAFCVIKLS
ncbi:regulator of G-protein signaling 9-binding protein [Arapaima gigas]